MQLLSSFQSLAAVLALLSVTAAAATKPATQETPRCAWGYKPSASDLQGQSFTLARGDDSMTSSMIDWNTDTFSTRDGGINLGITTMPEFKIKEDKNGSIHVTRTFNDNDRPNHVFTFGLNGNVPKSARDKGFKGDKYQMFLYYKDGHESECSMPKIDASIESISIQKLK